MGMLFQKEFDSKIFKIINLYKAKNILEGNLDLIPSPSPSVKIHIMGGKVCFEL